MALEKISGRVYADTTGSNAGNYGAIILDKEIIMVDAGMMHLKSAKVRDYLKSTFGLPITKILLTHHHSDHVFGAQAFEPITFISSVKTHEICKAALDAHWSEESIAEWAEEAKETRPELSESLLTQRVLIPDMTFEEELRIGNDIVLKHQGGHTAGSSIVIVEPEHVVFVGDQIFNKSFPYAGDSSCDPELWIKALENTLEANYKTYIPGHGPLCDADGVREQITFLEHFRDAVKTAIAEGLTGQQFLDEGRAPPHYIEGAEHRVKISVEHWFKYYGG